MAAPGNSPDGLEGEKTITDWQDLELLAEGRMSMRVINENGEVTKEVIHRRINGEGSREFVSKSGASGNQGWLQRTFPNRDR